MLAEHNVIYTHCMVSKTHSSTPTNDSARTTAKWDNNFGKERFPKFSQDSTKSPGSLKTKDTLRLQLQHQLLYTLIRYRNICKSLKIAAKTTHMLFSGQIQLLSWELNKTISMEKNPAGNTKWTFHLLHTSLCKLQLWGSTQLWNSSLIQSFASLTTCICIE